MGHSRSSSALVEAEPTNTNTNISMFVLRLHVVNPGVPAPFSERLADKVEENTERAPQKDERHVQHDGRDEAARNGPRRDELAEPVAPDVLVDGDGDENGAGDGFVAVNSIGGGDGRDGGDLDAGTGVANNDDGLEEICQRW